MLFAIDFFKIIVIINYEKDSCDAWLLFCDSLC